MYNINTCLQVYIYIYTWVWWGRWKERDSGLVRIVSRFSQSPKSGRQIQVIMARCPFLPCFVPGHLPWSESLVLADPYLQWFEGKILYSHSCTLSWCSEVKLKTKLPTHWSARKSAQNVAIINWVSMDIPSPAGAEIGQTLLKPGQKMDIPGYQVKYMLNMLKWILCVCASIALVLDFKAQQRGDAQANGPGSFAMAHQPQRSSGAAFEGQIGFSWVVSGCFWAVCSCLLMLISRFVNSFCWCVFFDIFWHVAMKSILYAVLFLVLRITPWSKRVAAQALTPELALKSELEAQRRVLSKVGRWSQWNHGGPLRHGGPQDLMGNSPRDVWVTWVMLLVSTGNGKLIVCLCSCLTLWCRFLKHRCLWVIIRWPRWNVFMFAWRMMLKRFETTRL